MKHRLALFLIIGCFATLLSFLLDSSVISIIAKIKTSLFDTLFGWITSFITVMVIFIVATTLFLLAEKKREWVLPLWLSFGLAALLSYFLKFLVARPRPSANFLSTFFPSLNYAFPSMHAAVCFATLPIINKQFPQFKNAWLVFALLISFSRIYLEVHYLSDVIFGAFIGYLIGLGIVYLEKKYKPFAWLQ